MRLPCDFTKQIDKPDLLTHNPSIKNQGFFNVNMPRNAPVAYGAVILTAIITALVNDRAGLRMVCGLVVALSLIGLSDPGQRFFSNTIEKPNDIGQETLQISYNH